MRLSIYTHACIDNGRGCITGNNRIIDQTSNIISQHRQLSGFGDPCLFILGANTRNPVRSHGNGKSFNIIIYRNDGGNGEVERTMKLDVR